MSSVLIVLAQAETSAGLPAQDNGSANWSGFRDRRLDRSYLDRARAQIAAARKIGTTTANRPATAAMPATRSAPGSNAQPLKSNFPSMTYWSAGGVTYPLVIHSHAAGIAHIGPERMNGQRYVVKAGTAAAIATVIASRSRQRGHRGAINSWRVRKCGSTGYAADRARLSAGRPEN